MVGGTKVQKEKHSEGTEPHFAEDIYIIFFFFKRFCDLKMSITSVNVAWVGFQITTCCKTRRVTNSTWHFLILLFWFLSFDFSCMVPGGGRAAPPAGWFPGSCPPTTWSASAPPWRRGWSGPAATRRSPQSAGRWRSAGRPGGGGKKAPLVSWQ